MVELLQRPVPARRAEARCQPADLRPGFVYDDILACVRQVVGGGESGRPGSDNCNSHERLILTCLVVRVERVSPYAWCSDGTGGAASGSLCPTTCVARLKSRQLIPVRTM